MNVSGGSGGGAGGGGGLLFVALNQDQGCFAAGLEDGFRVYNADPLKLKQRESFGGGQGVGQVEMLFRCNYLALVGQVPAAVAGQDGLSRSSVWIWDDVRKEAVIKLQLSSEVKAVRLRRDRIVVVLESLLKVFSFTTHPQQLHVFETAPNPRGLCALCPSSQRSLVAFPGRGFGDAELVDLAATDRAPLLIDAHEGALSALAMNVEGSLLATASEKGTLVRIFDTEGGAKLFELRRGAQPAAIHCLNFSHDARLLCVSSDHGTVHVFNLAPTANSSPKINKKLVPKYFRSITSTCQVRLSTGSGAKGSGCGTLCAFGAEEKTLVVMTGDGAYFKYAFDEKTGKAQRLTYASFLEMDD